MPVQLSTADAAVGRAKWRLVPFLLLMYVLSFLDRANVGFAKQAFQASTGLSDAAYGLGAGLFFITYALLEVPSNLIMHRVGARIWMCRIMVSWGLVSAGMMFAHGEVTFYLLRLLLGAAEAGFFPGVILYLTYWFPDRSRGQVMGLFYFGAPVAFVIGGPLSGLLLEMNGSLALEGWQWMFLVEGLLACAVGVWAYWYLDDRPADAAWLPGPEKEALLAELGDGAATHASEGALRSAVRSPRMLLFIGIYFLIQMSVYGVIFYLPTQVAALLGTKVGLRVGLLSAVPWICAIAATFWLPRIADGRGKHAAIAAASLAASAAGIAVSAGASPVIALAALCVAASGFIAVQPLFWTFPTGYFRGLAAAGAIALINALGALGGFVAPNLKAAADRVFGSPQAGLYVLSATTLLGAVLIASFRRSVPSRISPAPKEVS